MGRAGFGEFWMLLAIKSLISNGVAMRFLLTILLGLFISLPVQALTVGFKSSQTILTASFTAQPILAVEARAHDFVIQNPVGNSDPVFIGDSSVTTSGANIGIELSPGQSLILDSRAGLYSSAKIFAVSVEDSVPITVGRTSD